MKTKRNSFIGKNVKKQTLAMFSFSLLLSVAAASPAYADSWFHCGYLNQINWSCQLPSYSNTQYEYGLKYNTTEPLTVNCTYWSHGLRVANRDPYMMFSDNPLSGMRYGGFIFYHGTPASDDYTCSYGTWRHRYWHLDYHNKVTVTGWSNGCYGSNMAIYCRKR